MTRRASGRKPAPQSGSRPESRDSTRTLWPAPNELLDPRGPWLIPLLLLIVSRLVMWRLMPVAAEDAYITFRYARSLATGHGLVYNPGQHVFGFSSPLWTVWSAAGYALIHDPLVWSRAWSLLADLGTLVVGGALLERRVSRAAAWCFTFFFATWPYCAAVGMSGMENSAML